MHPQFFILNSIAKFLLIDCMKLGLNLLLRCLSSHCRIQHFERSYFIDLILIDRLQVSNLLLLRYKLFPQCPDQSLIVSLLAYYFLGWLNLDGFRDFDPLW